MPLISPKRLAFGLYVVFFDEIAELQVLIPSCDCRCPPSCCSRTARKSTSSLVPTRDAWKWVSPLGTTWWLRLTWLYAVIGQASSVMHVSIYDMPRESKSEVNYMYNVLLEYVLPSVLDEGIPIHHLCADSLGAIMPAALWSRHVTWLQASQMMVCRLRQRCALWRDLWNAVETGELEEIQCRSAGWVTTYPINRIQR